jgi:hypothetical protein
MDGFVQTLSLRAVPRDRVGPRGTSAPDFGAADEDVGGNFFCIRRRVPTVTLDRFPKTRKRVARRILHVRGYAGPIAGVTATRTS